MTQISPHLDARRILRISRVVGDLDRAESFYRDALGFRTVGRGKSDPAALTVLGFADSEASEVVMQLGEERVALVRPSTLGRPYPSESRSSDLWFQHLAIVVADMDAAYARLAASAGWSAISEGGPQLLPPANGAVRAFKFRDPDGHPLELLWFPPGQGRAVWHREAAGTLFRGIDHSALAVASSGRSADFYGGLGFRVAGRTLNHGPAQAALDGIADARVQVTSLRPVSDDGPGLELLAYDPPGRAAAAAAPNDLATDWVSLDVGAAPAAAPQALRDPDGHRLLAFARGDDRQH